MKPNGTYELVIYSGPVSRTLTGKLLAAVVASELRRYDTNAVQLYTLQYPLLPSGMPFEPNVGTWYVIETTSATGGGLEFIHESWIKENGITEVKATELVIRGTFKSGKSLEVLKAAFIRENLFDVALSLKKGQDKGAVTNPDLNIQYRLQLADTNNTALWGVYRGTVAYDMAKKANLAPDSDYAQYDWPTSHRDKLDSYHWMVFDALGNGRRFVVARELIAGDIYEDVNQGLFEFTKRGVMGDVGHLRSTLNIAGCTDVIIGTNG